MLIDEIYDVAIKDSWAKWCFYFKTFAFDNQMTNHFEKSFATIILAMTFGSNYIV